jgi:hypothetical protein
MVAAAILAVVGLAVVGAMSQAARTMRVTSDHTLVSLVTQKVVEETTQSFLDNPYADDDMQALSGRALSIANGEHPHFAVVEDSAPPYGRLETGRDLAIEPADEALFRLYRAMQLRYGVQAVPGNDNLLELSLTWGWGGNPGAAREQAFVLRLPRPRIVPALPTGGSPGALDASIHAVLFPSLSPGTDLAGAVTRLGGDLDGFRRIGRVIVPLREAIDALSDPEPAAGTASTPAEQIEQQLRSARAGERKVTLAWTALLVAQPMAEQLVNPLPDLGSDPAVRAMVTTTIRRAASFPAELRYHLGTALVAYTRAANLMATTGTRPYRRLTVEKKVLTLAKVQALMGCSSCQTFAAEWVRHLGRSYQGAGRSFESWLAREKEEVSSRSSLEAGNPVFLERALRIDPAVAALGEAARRLGPR